jgi:hypothetical protein
MARHQGGVRPAGIDRGVVCKDQPEVERSRAALDLIGETGAADL